jgi:hypothetical protein
VPIDDFVLMTDAMQRLLDSGGDRNATRAPAMAIMTCQSEPSLVT